MKTKLRYLIISWALLLPLFSQASHLAGADIQYTNTGKDSFAVTLRLYRDCNGTSVNDMVPLRVYTPECLNNQSAIVLLKRKAVRLLNFTCASQKTICEGGNFPFGLEEHVYEGNVYLRQLFPGLAQLSNCCALTMVYEMCCRNANISNGFGGNNFSVFAELNRCIKNSSPSFTNQPVAVACSAQPFCLSSGVVDNDQDSLSFKLGTPYGAYKSPLPWKSSFSAAAPFFFKGFPDSSLPFPSGLHMNSTSGDLCFQPEGISQQPVIVIEITEWRKVDGQYYRIGSIRRDIQFYVMNCNNNNVPSLEVNGQKEGPFAFTFCAGETRCINIIARDKDKYASKIDTTYLGTGALPPSSVFINSNAQGNKVREDIGNFCWSPGFNHISSLPYLFIVHARDNNCPVKGSTSQTFQVFVKARPMADRLYKRLKCLRYRIEAELLNPDVAGTGVQYNWSISRNNKGAFNPSFSDLFSGPIINEYKFADTGRFVIQLKAFNGECASTWYDTLYINAADLEANFPVQAGPDLSYCNIDTLIPLQVLPMSGPYSLISWNMEPFCNNCLRHNQQEEKLYLHPGSLTRGTPYKMIFKAVNQEGCIGSDTAEFLKKIAPWGDFSAADRDACQPLDVTFSSHFLNANTYAWDFGDPRSADNHSSSPTPSHRYQQAGEYDIRLQVTSPEGCDTSLRKTSYIRVHNSPQAAFIPDKIYSTIALTRFSFANASTNYTGHDSVSLLWDFGDHSRTDDSSSLQNPSYQYPTEKGRYEVSLTVKSRFGCSDHISQHVYVYPDITLFVPSAFRPSSLSGQTNTFRVVANDYKEINIQVYNRWGQQVFVSENAEDGWDGTLQGRECAEGVYAWIVKARGFDNREYNYSGTLNLLR